LGGVGWKGTTQYFILWNLLMNYNNLFEFELLKLVEARIASLTENVTNVGAVVDYPDYKYQVGRIAGLREIEDLREEVNRIISER
jgi:hypothetical protein